METEQVRINTAFEFAKEQLVQILPDDDLMQRIGKSLLEWVFCKKNSRPFRLLTDPNAAFIRESVRRAAEYSLHREYGDDYQLEIDPAILQHVHSAPT